MKTVTPNIYKTNIYKIERFKTLYLNNIIIKHKNKNKLNQPLNINNKHI